MSAALNGLGHQLLASLGPLSIELAAVAGLVLAVGRLIRSPALRHLLVARRARQAAHRPGGQLALHNTRAAGAAGGAWLGCHRPRAGGAPGGAGSSWCNHCLDERAADSCRLGGAAVARGHDFVDRADSGRLRHAPAHAAAGAGAARGAALRRPCGRRVPALDCHPRVEVATSPSIRSPMVLGILRLLIVVPTHDRREAQPRPTRPGPHARVGSRSPLRQPRAAGPETRHRSPVLPSRSLAVRPHAAARSPSRPATISSSAPPAARKPMRAASPWSPKVRHSPTIHPGDSP